MVSFCLNNLSFLFHITLKALNPPNMHLYTGARWGDLIKFFLFKRHTKILIVHMNLGGYTRTLFM